MMTHNKIKRTNRIPSADLAKMIEKNTAAINFQVLNIEK